MIRIVPTMISYQPSHTRHHTVVTQPFHTPNLWNALPLSRMQIYLNLTNHGHIYLKLANDGYFKRNLTKIQYHDTKIDFFAFIMVNVFLAALETLHDMFLTNPRYNLLFSGIC